MSCRGVAVVLLAFATLSLFSVACSKSTASRPEVHAPAAPSTSNTDEPLVPLVERPLEARNARACEVLTAGQLRALDLATDSATDISNGNASSCDWTSEDESFQIGIALSVTRNLKLFYEMHDTFQTFEPEVISGYPAVRTTPADGASCLILVGTSDDQSFSAQAGGLAGPPRDFCSVAERVAAAVLTSLPPRP
jgi:hypothetical protein